MRARFAFRHIATGSSSTPLKPARTITAGNFPPVMARKPQNVSNESQLQSPIQPQRNAFKDSIARACSNPNVVRIPVASQKRGASAEAAFKQWLRRSKLGYMIVDQTPLSVPISADKLKRPDYLVGILSGTIAIDVKGRDLFDGCGIIELDEYEGFHFFQRYFGAPVWYAWYPDKGHATCFLFRNTDIKWEHRRLLKGRTVIAVPLDIMTECHPLSEGFDYALFLASRSGA